MADGAGKAMSDMFASGGELGALMRALDWSSSPVGPPEAWSPGLLATVNLLLPAGAQIVLFWGPEYVAFYNDAYAPTIGDKHPRALGRPACENWSELWDDLEPLLRSVRETGDSVVARDRPFYIERSGFGEEVFFDISYSAVRSGDGAVEGVVCIVSETTDRVRAEGALRDSEARLRLIQSAGGVGSFDWDMKSGAIHRSADYLALHGLPADSPLDSAYTDLWRDRIHPDDRADVDRWFARDIATPGAFEHMYRIRRVSDGETRWIINRGAVLADEAGAPSRLLSAQIDVTDRKSIEDQLRLVHQSTGIGTWEYVFGQGVTWSPEIYKLYDRDPALGPPTDAEWAAMLHPDDVSAPVRPVVELDRDQTVFDREFRVRRADGGWRWLAARGLIERDAGGKPARVIGVNIDVTERREAEERLRESEARARIALEAARMGTFSLDPRTGAVEQDDVTKAMFGRAPSVQPDGDWLRSIHPDDRAMMRSKMDEALDPDGPRWIEAEFRALADDGVERWLLVRGESRFAGDVCIDYSGVLLDISERKRAEERIRESEARTRIALDAAGFGVWEMDVERNRLQWDARTKKMFGLPPDAPEPTIEGWLASVHPDDRDRMAAELADQLDAELPGRVVQAEFRAIGLQDDVERWLSVRGERQVENGRVVRLSGILDDVTAARAAVRVLRESEERFRLIADSAPVPIWVTKLDRTRGFVNRAYVEFLGVPYDDALVFDWRTVIHPDDVQQLLAASVAGEAALKPFTLEGRYRRADGEWRWLRSESQPRWDADGAHVGFIGVAHDVTEAKEAELRLRESETRFREQFENANDYIFTTDLEMRLTSANPAVAAAFGGKPADFIGRSIHEFTPRAVVDVNRAMLATKLEGRAEATRYEVGVVGPDGDVLDWEINSRLIRDAAGNPTGIHAIARDISERKRAEEAVRASEEQLRLVTDALPVLISYLDGEGRYLFNNRAYEEWFGHSRDEIAGHHMRDVLGDAAFSKIEPYVARAIAGEHVRFEGRVPYRDGGARDVLVEYVPRLDAGGSPIGFYAMVQDIGERKAAELRMRRADAERQAILQRLAEGVIVTDAHGHITFSNAAAAALHGVDHLDPTPGSYSRMFTLLKEDGEPFAEMEKPLTRAFTDGIASSGIRWRIGRPDGVEIVALGGAQPIVGPGGGLMGAVLTFSDDTARKAAEDRLTELNETLEARVAEEIAERLRAEEALRQAQKMEAIGKLTGGIAHDFNNLLTVIISSVDLLKRPSIADDKRARYIEAIGDTAERAAALTSQLLAFARRQPLSSEAFDATARVRAMRPVLHTMLGTGVRLTVRAPGEPQIVKADPNQFESALLNMAVNARDAMPEGGRLTITVAADDDPEQVCVSVADTGEGIPPELLQSIFEPFYTTKSVGKGTGLGLSQVYGFAKQSGGWIDVSSEPGKGTVFTLKLPRGVLSERVVSAAGDEPPADCAAAACNILVVEDNRAVGEFAARLLDDMGHEVTLETDATAALARIEAGEAFDLVFTDVIMPGALDGLALARALRADHPALPVILTTGYAQGLAEDATHGFEILRKPYSAKSLAALIAKSVRAA